MKPDTEEAVAIIGMGMILLILIGLIGFGVFGEEWQRGFYQFLGWFWY